MNREIELCPKIKEAGYMKEIKAGDKVLTHKAVWGAENIELIAWIVRDNAILVSVVTQTFVSHPIDKLIPLLTLEDCLEFFRERALYLENLCQTDECEYMCIICEIDDLGLVKGTASSFEGETALIAALSAVLAVVGEGK